MVLRDNPERFEGGNKYLSVPSDDHSQGEDEELVAHRRNSAKLMSRVLRYGVLFSLLTAMTAVGIYYTQHITENSAAVDDDFPLFTDDYVTNFCHIGKTCKHIYIPYDFDTGFTNLTGWQSGHDTNCCNVCGFSTNTENTKIITRRLEDIDYIFFDQIWLPQLCYAFDIGHDPTLSHIPGSKCVSKYTSSRPRLTIHGVWPNRVDGNNFCCARQKTSVPPINPLDIQHSSIYGDLQTYWPDPSTTDVDKYTECSTCYLLNHEWQKHGSCYDYYVAENVTTAALRYFQTGLDLHARLNESVEAINALNGTIVERTMIESFFNYSVSVNCDPKDNYSADPSVGVFLEIGTCWRNSEALAVDVNGQIFGDLEMMNCPANSGNTFTAPCPERVFLRNFT